MKAAILKINGERNNAFPNINIKSFGTFGGFFLIKFRIIILKLQKIKIILPYEQFYPLWYYRKSL